MHRCSNADFEKFNSIENIAAAKVKKFKEGDHWFCYDDSALDFEIKGTWRTDEVYNALDIRLLPCASQYTAFDGNIHGGDESCEWDLTEV